MNHLNKAMLVIAAMTVAGQAQAATITFEEGGHGDEQLARNTRSSQRSVVEPISGDGWSAVYF
jgi:hypothetical protein